MPVELRHRELGEVAEAVERREAGAALEPGRERLADHLGAGRRGDPARGAQARLAHGGAAEQQRDRLARLQRLGHDRDHVSSETAVAGRRRARRDRARAFEPRDVGGEDQRRDLARRQRRAAATASAASPATSSVRLDVRIQPETLLRQRVDVGVERRVVLVVVRRVVADDVDDRGVRAARVVQVGDAVAEPGPEVQQRGGGPVGHAGVAVGGAGDDALEQAEHRAHLGHGVERGDEVHLRRARVGEADVDAGVDEGADQGLGAVHGWSPPGRRWCRGSGSRRGRTRS